MPAAARKWCDRLLPEARRVGNRVVQAGVLHGQGLVERASGDLDEAEACFRQAVTLAAACGWAAGVADAARGDLGGTAGAQEGFIEAAAARWPPAPARTRRSATSDSRPTRPRVDADVAVARAALGDEFDATWAEGVGDVDSRRRWPSSPAVAASANDPTVGWASLTPTESKVVELVAGGLTNPQIAERLLMSRGTVKTHLSHVFDKLGVATRSELAAQEAVRAARPRAAALRRFGHLAAPTSATWQM